MPLKIEAINSGFAAVACGVDLRAPLDVVSIGAIVKALDEYGVLVFHEQPVTQDQQVACALQFGPLDTSLDTFLKKTQKRLDYSSLSDISNCGVPVRSTTWGRWHPFRAARACSSGLRSRLPHSPIRSRKCLHDWYKVFGENAVAYKNSETR